MVNIRIPYSYRHLRGGRMNRVHIGMLYISGGMLFATQESLNHDESSIKQIVGVGKCAMLCRDLMKATKLIACGFLGMLRSPHQELLRGADHGAAARRRGEQVEGRRDAGR